MIDGLGRDQEVVIMKNKLTCPPFVVESRHLICDPFHVPLPKTFPRSHPVKSRDTAIRTASITTATAHHVTGRHARKHMDRPAPIGEWQRIQVVQPWAPLRKA